MHHILFILELEILIQSRHKMSCVQQTQNSIKSKFSRRPLEGREMAVSMSVWVEGGFNAGPEDCTYRE